MAQIMIKCPVSNQAITTGVEVNSDADFNGLWMLRIMSIVHRAGSTTLGLRTTRGSRNDLSSISTPATRNKVDRKPDDCSPWSVAYVQHAETRRCRAASCHISTPRRTSLRVCNREAAVLELAIAFAISDFALEKTPQAEFDHHLPSISTRGSGRPCSARKSDQQDHQARRCVCGLRNLKRRGSNSHQPKRARELA